MDSLTVPATIEYLDEVTDFVESMIPPHCPDKLKLQLRLAVEEVFVNIASYAYEGKTGQALIRCELLADPLRIRVCFTDSGIAFDPLAKEDADTSEEALIAREGGLGILLVKNTMDKVEYRRADEKNILTIEKRLD